MSKLNKKQSRDLKTAILISGHLRSVEYVYENLLAIKKKINADIFIHTWSQQEMSSSTWRKPDAYKESSGITPGEIIKLLEPSSLMIENEEDAPDTFFELLKIESESNSTKPYPGCYYMLYGMNKVFQIYKDYCETKKKNYDVVVRYRFDISCNNFSSFEEDLNSAFTSGALIMPDHNLYSCLGATFDGVIFANPKLYASAISAINSGFHGQYIEMKASGKVVPEAIITNLIRDAKLTIKSCQTSFSLVRNYGKVEQEFFKHKSSRLRSIKSRIFVKSSKDINSTKGTIAANYIKKNSDFATDVLYCLLFIPVKMIKLVLKMAPK